MIKYDTLRRRRARLTITLSEDVIRQVDRHIDGKTLRNRSQAIETLLRKSLTPALTTVVILAGTPPKTKHLAALTPINGKTLISVTLEHLKSFGIKEVIILAGTNQPFLQEEVGTGERFGLHLTFVREPHPLGTAGAVKYVEKILSQKPFLVLHGDILTDINLEDLVRFHQEKGTLATIAVKPRYSERHYGQVMLEGNRITDFFEHDQGLGVSIVNTGLYLFEPEVLNLIPAKKPVRLESDIFPQLAKMGQLSAFMFQGIWFDISTRESYQQALHRWQLAH